MRTPTTSNKIQRDVIQYQYTVKFIAQVSLVKIKAVTSIYPRTVASLNTRTLKDPEKILELKRVLEKLKINIIEELGTYYKTK